MALLIIEELESFLNKLRNVARFQVQSDAVTKLKYSTAFSSTNLTKFCTVVLATTANQMR